MSQKDTARSAPDLSDLDGIDAILINLQRRFGKVSTPENAIIRDAVREALLVTGRAKKHREALSGVAGNRR